ncbi:MAG: hypothetical protein JWO35_630 [Candidatus Saccharibacteria bacterium]|nr:hypothetical protein [Candidatus Saccharibacteria bacterium]
MSELEKTLEPAEVITSAFEQWLSAEVQNSYDDNNAVLNDYSLFQRSLALPYDDHRNVNAQKSVSHHGRFQSWTDELFVGHPEEDAATGRQIFAVLMGLSGAFREQCFLLSSDNETYMRNRYGTGALGIHMGKAVVNRLTYHYGKQPVADDLNKPVISIDTLVSNTHDVNDTRLAFTKALYSQEALTESRKNTCIARQIELRMRWVDLGVDYVLFAAQTHNGDLSKVPFYQPKSITHAQLVKPLGHEPPYFVADNDKVITGSESRPVV